MSGGHFGRTHGRYHSGCCADEQIVVQMGAKSRQCVTDRRRAKADCLSRSKHIPLSHDRVEDDQKIEIHASHD